MCAIIGSYQKNEIEVEKFSLEVDKLFNRELDNQSILKIRNNLVFGHTRLSIINWDDESNKPINIKLFNFM